MFIVFTKFCFEVVRFLLCNVLFFILISSGLTFFLGSFISSLHVWPMYTSCLLHGPMLINFTRLFALNNFFVYFISLRLRAGVNCIKENSKSLLRVFNLCLL